MSEAISRDPGRKKKEECVIREGKEAIREASESNRRLSRLIPGESRTKEGEKYSPMNRKRMEEEEES